MVEAVGGGAGAGAQLVGFAWHAHTAGSILKLPQVGPTHTCDPDPWEDEVGDSELQGHPPR